MSPQNDKFLENIKNDTEFGTKGNMHGFAPLYANK